MKSEPRNNMLNFSPKVSFGNPNKESEDLINKSSTENKQFRFTFGNPRAPTVLRMGDSPKQNQRQDARPTANDPNSWRQNEDPLMLYQIDKYLRVGNIVEEEVNELTRWKQNDMKGQRKTYYNKQVGSGTDMILIPVEQSRLEKLMTYEDRWPLLGFRKALMKGAIYVNMAAVRISSHKAFETTSIIIILLNCIQLASEDTTVTEVSRMSQIIDYNFLAAYSIEMIVKILAKGFVFNQGAYLRDSFNILDFVIVMSAYVTIIQEGLAKKGDAYGPQTSGGMSLNALRAFRVLRPLRSITAIKGLRILVQSLLAALPLLKDTIIVLFFFLIIFAIAGIQLIAGKLKYRCVDIFTGRMVIDSDVGLDLQLSDGGIICGAYKCPAGPYYCGKINQNPDHGVTNYDNILWAVIMTFQNITLEGWSDTMKYYEMASGIIIIVFFISSVFIGAFFLLNLTLAVINSSFSRMNEKYMKQAQEERDRKRKLMQDGPKKKDDDDEDDGLIQEEQDQNERKFKVQIGLHEYYVAKRAVRKMLQFYKHRKEEKQRISKEEEMKRLEREEEEAELLRQAAKSGEQASPNRQPRKKNSTQKIVSRPSSTDGKNDVDPDMSNLRRIKLQEFYRREDEKLAIQAARQQNTPQTSPVKARDVNFSNQRRKQEILVQPIDQKNSPIHQIQEDHTSNSEDAKSLKQHVDKFLASIESDHELKATQSARKRKDKIEILPLMVEGIQHKLKGFLESTEKPLNIYNINKESINFLEDYTLDKIIAEEHLQPQNVYVTKNPSDEKTNSLLTLQTWEVPHYLSDDDKKKPMKRFIRNEDEEQESAILSDESFNREIALLEAAALEANYGRKKWYNRKQDKNAQYKAARQRHRQQRSLDSRAIKNDDNPTFTKSNFFKEDINLQKRKCKMRHTTELSLEKKIRETKTKANYKTEFDLKRKEMSGFYKNVDDAFLNFKKPKDPYEYIDRKTKKIDINPGAKYISSSMFEILEPRQYSRANRKTAKQGANRFLIPAYENGEKTYDDGYIESVWDAYQLKTRYNIKEVEQVEFDSDDEDNLILAIQPYDTLINVGYSDLLKHIQTKFLSRRSDILVSSTMSITLTPINEFMPTITNNMKMGDAELERWVNLRHEYRALNFFQAKPNPHKDDQVLSHENLDASQGSNSDQPSSSRYNSTSRNNESFQQLVKQKTSLTAKSNNSNKHEISRAKRKLPKNGLSQLLKPEEIAFLDEDQKLLYSKWCGKYEVSQRNLKEKAKRGETKYTLADAQKLLEGTYYADENEDDDKNNEKEKDGNADLQTQRSCFLNRETLKEDLDLAGFEKALQKILKQEFEEWQKNLDQKFQEQLKKDTISDDLRKEFDLPDNIKDRKLDFNEIRRSDATFKRKKHNWSGQDVLQFSLNRDQSEAVTSKMNSLRVWPKGFEGVLKRARFLVKTFIMHDVMDNAMTFAVLVNTIVMALDRYGVSEKEDKITTKINQFFTFLFISEFGLKMIAIGPKKYVDNRMNLLDGAVVMLSLFELAMGSGGKGALSAFRSVRVFRTFRVLRVARVLRSLKSMQNIVSVISRSASSFAYIAVLLMIFLFIFALLGKQIFAGKFNFDSGTPRSNYDSFNAAFLTVFQTLTMENWNSLLYDAIRANVFIAISCFYYISWIFIGNFILLNLFLAILLDSFLEEDEEEMSSEEALAAQKAAEDFKKMQVKREKERRMKKLGSTFQRTELMDHFKTPKAKKNNFRNFTKKVEPADELIDDVDDLDEGQLLSYLVELQYVKLTKDEMKPITFEDSEIECDKALYLFSQQNRFRVFMLRLSKSKFFDVFIMGLILLSSVKLAADSYIVDQIQRKAGVAYQVSKYADMFFTILFTLEMVTKIISMGLFMDSGSYLRESWNQLDFFIVITSLIDLSLTGKKVGFIKVIRILRILRPLRFISHNQSMKMIVAALLDTGGSMLNTSIVIMIVWLMFAILAINLFSGKFFYCDTDAYYYHSKTDCLNAGHQWLRFDTNFDSVPQAMKALYIISTFEGWPDILHQAVDATGVDQGPAFQNQIYYGYFFVVFILIGVFFFKNFLIGVLFLKYSQAQKEETKNFTQDHLNWIDIQKMIEKAKVNHENRYKPRGPGSEWRMKVWKIVISDWFQNFVMLVIMLNMISMACAYDGNPAYWEKTLKIANYVFSAIFFVEASLKLYVYRKAYFYTTWNKFDFFVVSASILDVLMDLISGAKLKALSVAPQLARVLRVLRVSRVLRLAGKNEGLQALLMTIQMSVSSLLNVTALLVLIFFMFAVLGVSMFQNVTQSDDVITLNQIDPNYKNFGVFHMGFILIFVLSTGENWPLVMYDVGHSKPNCGPTTCGSSLATLYFFVFVMVVQNIMLNLFILVIIQQFEQYYVSEDNPIQKFKNNLEVFEKVWIEFTETSHHIRIKERDLDKFFRKLPPPIGIPEDVSDKDMHKQLLKLGIRSEGGFIYFNELLYRCMRRQYGNFKLNRAMTIYEVSTQFRLLMLRNTEEKTLKMNDFKLVLSKLNKIDFSFNPFMLQMFIKMSFQTWQNMARNEIEYRLRCQQLQIYVAAKRDDNSRASCNPSSAKRPLRKQELNGFFASIFYVKSEPPTTSNESKSILNDASSIQPALRSELAEKAREEGIEFHQSQVVRVDKDIQMVPVSVEIVEEVMISSDEESSNDEKNDEITSKTKTNENGNDAVSQSQDNESSKLTFNIKLRNAMLKKLEKAKQNTMFNSKQSFMKMDANYQVHSAVKSEMSDQMIVSPTKHERAINQLEKLGLIPSEKKSTKKKMTRKSDYSHSPRMAAEDGYSKESNTKQ